MVVRLLWVRTSGRGSGPGRELTPGVAGREGPGREGMKEEWRVDAPLVRGRGTRVVSRRPRRGLRGPPRPDVGYSRCRAPPRSGRGRALLPAGCRPLRPRRAPRALGAPDLASRVCRSGGGEAEAGPAPAPPAPPPCVPRPGAAAPAPRPSSPGLFSAAPPGWGAVRPPVRAAQGRQAGRGRRPSAARRASGGYLRKGTRGASGAAPARGGGYREHGSRAMHSRGPGRVGVGKSRTLLMDPERCE